ncbi:MAG: hypothetical protein ABSA81_07935 [Candidatus Bathyarchaeia archaeon]
MAETILYASPDPFIFEYAPSQFGSGIASEGYVSDVEHRRVFQGFKPLPIGDGIGSTRYLLCDAVHYLQRYRGFEDSEFFRRPNGSVKRDLSVKALLDGCPVYLPYEHVIHCSIANDSLREVRPERIVGESDVCAGGVRDSDSPCCVG